MFITSRFFCAPEPNSYPDEQTLSFAFIQVGIIANEMDH